MISVYDSTEKDFAHNGIKILHPLYAKITKEDNGDYYIDVKDSIDNLDYYKEGMIIRVDTPWGKQGFRLTNPEIEKNKIIVKGYHLYFDTKRYIIVDSYVVEKNCNDALDHLNNACDKTTPFTFISDISTINSFRCVRRTLEEAIATIIERWGGHLVRDNFNIEVRNAIGEDRGVVLSYAKNIESIKASENWDDVVTKILPVGKNGLLLPEIWIEDNVTYDIPYTKVISFDQSSIIEEDYQIDGELDEIAYNNALMNNLREQATNYIDAHKLPVVNYSVSSNIQNISDVGDIIHVKHPKCNINITTNVIAIEYDCISKKYTKIEFGNFKNKLGDLMENITSVVNKEVKKENNNNYVILHKELEEATNKIKSVMGASYVIYDGSQIMVVDKLPKEEAKNVILINNGGIGFSQNGINGTFKSAWTIDGTLNMQNINVINLVADLIKGGTLKLGGSNNSNGCIEIYDESGNEIGRIDKNGFSLEITSGLKNISDFIDDVDDSINTLDTTVENNRQELLKKFDGYVPTSDLVQLEQKVQTIQTDTYTKTEINTKLIDGSVKKVSTTSGTFDEDGMHYEKSNAPTSSTINHLGVDVKSAENNQSLLFAGYDEELNESIVKTENLTVNKYFVCGNSRIENYGTGGGIFVL